MPWAQASDPVFSDAFNYLKRREAIVIIVIALCLQYELKGYPRKFLELLAGTPLHLTLNQVSYHSAESIQ